MGYELNRADIFDLAASLTRETKVKGDELFFTYCPYCGGGQSRDRDTFSINLITGQFNCFRSGCNRHGHFVEMARDFHYKLDFKENVRPRTYRQFPQRPVEVRNPAVEYLAGRGIGREVAERYRVTCRSDRPDVLVFPFYDPDGVLCYVKYRNAHHQKGQGSKEWAEKDGKPILFGMDQCKDFGRLVVTEGQIDSLTLAECGISNGKYQEWLTSEGLLRLEGWARDGLTDEQIAHNVGISPSTLYAWKDKFPELSEALKHGKEVVDRQVENALLKRALGYRYTEVRVEESEKDGQKITRTEKVIPPDTTAQIFWLKNRKPAQWRDKPPEPPDPNAKSDNGLVAALKESAKEVFPDGVFGIQPEATAGNDLVGTPGSSDPI